MPHPASNDALMALTEWWEDMGVEVDASFVQALTASAGYGQVGAVAAPKPAPKPAIAGVQPAAEKPKRLARGKSQKDWLAEAQALATGAGSLSDLKTAIESFEGCGLKAAAQNTVVWDGLEGAPLMVIGEGPGAQEDREGRPFIGKAGQLLDKMLAAIGQTRETNTFITNVNYWRPPNNRNPEAEELELCRPFVDRMVELAAPKLIVTAGAVPSKALLGVGDGIMKLRGGEQVFETRGGASVPLIPILHPAYLLRRPQEKSRAWRDLLLIEARLAELCK